MTSPSGSLHLDIPQLGWTTEVEVDHLPGQVSLPVVNVRASLRWQTFTGLTKHHHYKGRIQFERMEMTNCYRIKYNDGHSVGADGVLGEKSKGILYLPADVVGRIRCGVLQSKTKRANAIKVSYDDNDDNIQMIQIIAPGLDHFTDYSGLVFGQALKSMQNIVEEEPIAED